MKLTASVSQAEGKEKELYRAFLRLDPGRRTRVALRILHDEKVLADIYDHFLIQRSLKERGRDTSWQAYLRRRKSNGR